MAIHSSKVTRTCPKLGSLLLSYFDRMSVAMTIKWNDFIPTIFWIDKYWAIIQHSVIAGIMDTTLPIFSSKNASMVRMGISRRFFKPIWGGLGNLIFGLHILMSLQIPLTF